MRNGRKVVHGIGLYREDWDRIKTLLGPREKQIDLIESALLHEFELREGKAQHVPARAAA